MTTVVGIDIGWCSGRIERMEYFWEFSEWLGWRMRPYLSQISMALVAALLFIYGSTVNAAIKTRIQGQFLIIRVLIFVAVCAFGYGAATVFIAMLLARLLNALDVCYLFPFVLCFLFGVGLLAEHRKQI